MKVLVADDDSTSRLIAETVLRGLGHECEAVASGDQAWEAFQSSRPDVVISDWVMPGLTGLELCRKIRAHTFGGSTYFVMVTRQGGLEHILEGMNSGADDYLIKPLDSHDLQAGLIAAARVTSLHSQLAGQRTELETLNHRLAESNEELRDLDRLKGEFVALVSHELRTPLTSILGSISAMKRGRAGVVPAEQVELLDIVDRNSQRLFRLVADLLLAAKVDAGTLQLEPDPFELGRIVGHAVELERHRAAQQRIGLNLVVSDTAWVVADHARLLQLFDHLVSNAIKFSSAGDTVDVVVTVEGASATIEIRDEGIGIPLEEQDQVFQRFFRASTATSREIPGTGLGLAIAKTIVELHKGTIEVRNRESAGTVFTVILPLAHAEEVASWKPE